MVAEPYSVEGADGVRCSLAKISMVAEHCVDSFRWVVRCSLAKISMVAELWQYRYASAIGCSLAKISMVAEQLSS